MKLELDTRVFQRAVGAVRAPPSGMMNQHLLHSDAPSNSITQCTDPLDGHDAVSYCDSVLKHVASQRRAELEKTAQSCGPKCCVQGEKDRKKREDDEKTMLNEDISFDEFVCWWKDTVEYESFVFPTREEADEWIQAKEDQAKKEELIGNASARIKDKIGLTVADARVEQVFAIHEAEGRDTKKLERVTSNRALRKNKASGTLAFCAVCEIAELWDDYHVREDTYDNIKEEQILPLLKKMNVDTWKFPKRTELINPKYQRTVDVAFNATFKDWFHTHFCTWNCGLVYVIVFATACAALRLGLEQIEVTAYGECGAAQVLFGETREYETVFYWWVGPPFCCTMVDCFLMAQLRRVAHGPNHRRILSLSSNKVSPLTKLRETLAHGSHIVLLLLNAAVCVQDMPIWWSEEIRSVTFPAPMEFLLFSTFFVGFYGVHPGEYGSGFWYFVAVECFHFFAGFVGALLRPMTLRYQRSHIISYLGKSPPWNRCFKAMLLGWTVAVPVTMHIWLRGSYTINDDLISAGSNYGANCTEMAAIRQCVAESVNSLDTVVLGRYQDPVVRGNAYCSATLSMGMILLLYYTPIIYVCLDAPGLLNDLKPTQMAKVDGCKCALCSGVHQVRENSVREPCLWKIYKKFMALLGVVGAVMFIFTNVTWVCAPSCLSTKCVSESVARAYSRNCCVHRYFTVLASAISAQTETT